MDFNDLSTRIQRTYLSIDARYNYDIDANLKNDISVNNGHMKIQTSFGTNTEAELYNIIMGSIGAIADLKDHLKVRMVQNGKNANDVEAMINNSLELSLITDLNNKDKHGDPLTRTERSGKDPKIANVQQGLTVAGPGVFSFSMSFDGQNVTPGPRTGMQKIVVIADIQDGQGNNLMQFSSMIDAALITIEAFINSNNLN